jgi:hypothetical protein
MNLRHQGRLDPINSFRDDNSNSPAEVASTGRNVNSGHYSLWFGGSAAKELRVRFLGGILLKQLQNRSHQPDASHPEGIRRLIGSAAVC